MQPRCSVTPKQSRGISIGSFNTDMSYPKWSAVVGISSGPIQAASFHPSQLDSVRYISSNRSKSALMFTSNFTRRCPSFNLHWPRSIFSSSLSKDKAPSVPAWKTSHASFCSWSWPLMYPKANLNLSGPMLSSFRKLEAVAWSACRKAVRELGGTSSACSTAIDTHLRDEWLCSMSESRTFQVFDWGSGVYRP